MEENKFDWDEEKGLLYHGEDGAKRLKDLPKFEVEGLMAELPGGRGEPYDTGTQEMSRSDRARAQYDSQTPKSARVSTGNDRAGSDIKGSNSV